jgi:hypothetical protein
MPISEESRERILAAMTNFLLNTPFICRNVAVENLEQGSPFCVPQFTMTGLVERQSSMRESLQRLTERPVTTATVI